MSRFLLLLLLGTPLFSDLLDINASITGSTYFTEKNYAKALPLLQQEVAKGLKPSMYQLGYMYQHGLGVPQDYHKAATLFQRAASDFEYTLAVPNSKDIVKASFAQRLSSQLDPSTNKSGDAFALSKLDTDTPEAKGLLTAFLSDGFFGLKPYKTNYILPLAYAGNKYPHISSNTHYSNYTPQETQEYGVYDSNIEVEFELSLRKPLTYNLFGLNESINVAYTQKVWWQLYSLSAPFRETNYAPEIFIVIPTSRGIDNRSGLKALKVGYIHESNGQEGYRSRSWNRLYFSGMWQWKNLLLATRVWYRIPENKKYEGYYIGKPNPKTGLYEPNYSGDDNPHIEEYLGFGDIRINYLYKKHQFGALLRYNFGSGGTHRGAMDIHWSYPFLHSKNTFWYVKLFNGYAESLIDYDQSVTKASFGFSFSRALF